MAPRAITAAGVRYTSGLVAHEGHERSPLRWRSGHGRWGRNQRDPADRPSVELGERHPLCCTAVSRWTGMAIYPNLIVPLQLVLAIGDRRYLFGCSGTCGPEPMFDYSDPPLPSSSPGPRTGRLRGPHERSGVGDRVGHQRAGVGSLSPAHERFATQYPRLATADCELNPHGRSPVLTCSFMRFVGVQIGVGGPTAHRTTRALVASRQHHRHWSGGSWPHDQQFLEAEEPPVAGPSDRAERQRHRSAHGHQDVFHPVDRGDDSGWDQRHVPDADADTRPEPERCSGVPSGGHAVQHAGYAVSGCAGSRDHSGRYWWTH